jgi:O-antigen/teichoic acid export membrane protein
MSFLDKAVDVAEPKRVPTMGEQLATDRPRPDRRRIATNFLTQAASNMLGLLITILVSIYVLRALGPAAIGQVNWVQAAISYFTILVNPGLTLVGQRELAKSPQRSGELMSLILTLQTLFALAVYGLVVVIATLDLRGPVVSLLLLIQGVGLFLSALNAGWLLQANERMVAPSLASLAFNALQLPVLLFFIHRPDDVLLYAALGLPFTMMGVAFNFWYAAHRGLLQPLHLRPTLAGAGALLREAWPLALTQSAILIYFNSDTLILGFTDGDEAVGQYATAYKLMMVAAVITVALWNAYFPVLARSHNSSAEATALSREYLGLLAWTGLPIAALGWAEGRHVVELMYGAAFAASGPYFEWLCLNIAIQFLNYGITSTLVPWGYSRLQFKISASGAAANLALNAIAIPLFGPWGAIATTLAAEGLVLALGLEVRRRRAIFWHPVLPIVAPPLACSAAVALVLHVLPVSLDRYWYLQLVVGVAILGACLWIFERRAIAGLIGRKTPV